MDRIFGLLGAIMMTADHLIIASFYGVRRTFAPHLE